MMMFSAECKEALQALNGPIHRIILETRYMLESAGKRLRNDDAETGSDVLQIAHVLPYLWSGGRTVPVPSTDLDEYTKEANDIAAKYGLFLPDDPIEAVPIILRLATHLLDPEDSMLLDDMQRKFGTKK